jgi:hypothetical protein
MRQHLQITKDFTMSVYPVSLIFSSFSGLATAFKLVEVGLRISDVPIDSLVFVELLASVQADLEHALECQREVGDVFNFQPVHHTEWINKTILRTIRALNEIGTYVLGVEINHERSPSLGRRITYLLHNYKKLSDREKWLRACHGSLLSAITAMHLILYPQFTKSRAQYGGVQITVPTLSPEPSPTQTTSRTPMRFSNQPTSLSPQAPVQSSYPYLSSENTHSLPSVLEVTAITDDDSPRSSMTESRPALRSHISLPETEYQYPELVNAFSERRSIDALNRPSRQRPFESTQSLPINSIAAELPEHGSDKTSDLPDLNTDPRQRSYTSLPETGITSTVQEEESRGRRKSDIPKRPSRQKPRPHSKYSFSETVLQSTNMRLSNLSRIPTLNKAARSELPTDSTEVKPEGVPYVGEFDLLFTRSGFSTNSHVLAASVAYGELLDYLQLLRRQSFIGDTSGIDLSM